MTLQKFTKRFLVIINLVVAVLFGFTALFPYVDAMKWWWLNLIGLVFPYLFFIVVFFLLFWLVIKPKYSIVSLLVLLLCWRQITMVFRLSMADFNYKRNEQVLRVLSWNVRVFEGLHKSSNGAAKEAIVGFIKSTGADIVCLQEFSQYDSMGLKKNHIKALKDAGYGYYLFSNDYEKASVDYHSGVAVFSKTPLLSQQRVAFTATRESVVYADVAFGTDTFRIFTTHLQSFKFSKADYRNIDWLKRRGDITNPGNLNVLSKMKTAIRLRALQAQQIQPLLDSSPYPEILCGDFNDVPNSYSYQHLRGSRKDAFVEKGNGAGRTFLSLAPMLRIDYVLYDDRLQIDQFTTANQRFSDHLPLIADFRLNDDMK